MVLDSHRWHRRFAVALVIAGNAALLAGCGNVSGSGPSQTSSVKVVAAGAVTSSSSNLNFGSIPVGSSSSQYQTLTNTGAASVTISQATASGAGFSISGLTAPVVLASNQSVTFNTIFAPTGTGAATGAVNIVSDASNSQLNIALSGMGTAAGQLLVSPASLSFGSVVVGSSASLDGTLTANGQTLTVTAATPNNSEFILSGISPPVTIPAGQAVTFTVTFTPQASGATSTSLSFATSVTNSPALQSVSGIGAAPNQHSVDLAWTASADAVGYNIYRGITPTGPYTIINTALNGTTTFTDSAVASGQTYYYVAAAVNASSEESGYSNQAEAVIPNP